ncbi:hypothetical protein D3C81_1643180 [compost metagenome]
MKRHLGQGIDIVADQHGAKLWLETHAVAHEAPTQEAAVDRIAEHQAAVLAQGLRRSRHAGACQVTRRGAADERDPGYVPRQQVFLQLRSNAQADIHILTRMVDPSISHYQLYRKLGITGTECRDQGRQHMAAKGRCRCNAQAALGLAVGRGNSQLGLGKVTLHLPDPLVVKRTSRR